MKNKKEVYVVVDTPKKAKKLKKVLDMFNEPIYRETNQRLSEKGVSKEYPIIYFSSGVWVGYANVSYRGKTEVSIKELKRILAKEHLKVGDYVVNKDGDIDSIRTLNNFDYTWFKGYANPEEIALLEDKPKDLVIGKWYFAELDNERKTLFCFSGEYGQFTQYGFNVSSKWSNQLGCIQGLKYTEATPQEVESALIEEARRRYKFGDKVKDVNGIEIVPKGSYVFKGEVLYYGGAVVMKNGKWAEVIKNDDKFAELKEAHNNGSVIEVKYRKPYNENSTWNESNEDVLWNPIFEHRIKPEEKPKVGGVCKFWNWDENVYAVARLEGVRGNSSFPYASDTTVLYKNAKTITPQEAIDLLFKK